MGEVVKLKPHKKDIEQKRLEAYSEFLTCIGLADSYLARAQELQEKYNFKRQ